MTGQEGDEILPRKSKNQMTLFEGSADEEYQSLKDDRNKVNSCFHHQLQTILLIQFFSVSFVLVDLCSFQVLRIISLRLEKKNMK
jgi:hypothetical protein